ncbi:Na(+)-translocating NADH-quinone reductase subunit C [Chlamydia trachomatis]|nr:Na(+)-translocating NADH-quinone reductase subunit C [Chlamydia trachomatis]
MYGTNFSHQGETPGLGARITETGFQDEFKGKSLYRDGAFKSVVVVKKGQKSTDGGDYVDGLSGATITSRGVSDMLLHCLAPYNAFFKKLQSSTASK